MVCFDYVTQNVGKTSLTIYFPAFWSASDPRRAYLALAADAMQDSAETYNKYRGALKNTRLVFTELANGSKGTGDPTVWAEADQDKAGCIIGVYPSSTKEVPDTFKQIIAHEMFHCFQVSFLYTQAYVVKSTFNDWRVENSADFFSNLVYPSVNLEWDNLPVFDINMKDNDIFHGSYENSVFFQFLANNAGIKPAQIIDLLASMPVSGGFSEQRSALAAFPDIDNLWHKFGQDYVDRKINDSSMTALPLNPRYQNIFSYALGEKKGSFSVKPFMIKYSLDLFNTFAN